MDDKQDVAGLVERLRAMVSREGRALVFNGRTTKVMCDDLTEAATALEAQAAEIARLKEDVRRWKATSDDHFRNAERLARALTGSQQP